MQRLTASDAIAPAWNHVNKLLLAPRSWRLLLKIGVVAAFAQAGGGSGGLSRMNLPSGSGGSSAPKFPTMTMPVFTPGMVMAIVVVSVVLFLLMLGLIYLSSRLRFVFFEVILRSDTRIGPIWGRYGGLAWRWIGLRLLLGFVTLLLIAPVLVPLLIQIVRIVMHHETVDLGSMLGSLFGALALMVLIALVMGCVATFLGDFGLPMMALEMTTIGETLQRVWKMVIAEPGQMLLYLFLKFVMALAIGIGTGVVLVLVLLLAMIPLGVVSALLWFGLHGAGATGYALMITGWVVLGLIFVVLTFCLSFMVAGVMQGFLEAYALYFLGGRMARVGEYLEPGPPPPFAPPPVFPGPDEDDDGPALPLNPALV